MNSILHIIDPESASLIKSNEKESLMSQRSNTTPTDIIIMVLVSHKNGVDMVYFILLFKNTRIEDCLCYFP